MFDKESVCLVVLFYDVQLVDNSLNNSCYIYLFIICFMTKVSVLLFPEDECFRSFKAVEDMCEDILQ